MNKQTIRDRLWLWGMKVNVLQEISYDSGLNLGRSTMTVEQAVQRTGITNVIMAGGLPISQESLEAMPSARRIICKWSLHRAAEGRNVVDYEDCLSRLMAAKELAASDTRIEGFLVDDFSTGSIDAGVSPEHLARLAQANAIYAPQLPLNGTIYTMSLERPELPALLPYFDQFILSIWHADQVDTVPAALDRLAKLSGSKPMKFWIYVFDFGNSKPIPRELMQRQLDLSERLLLEERIAGMGVCGTCLMDLDWEANHCLYEWIERVGDRIIEGG